MSKDELKGFAIQPKLDCPHLSDEKVANFISFLTEKNDKKF